MPTYYLSIDHKAYKYTLDEYLRFFFKIFKDNQVRIFKIVKDYKT